MKTSDFQDVVFSTLVDDKNVINNKLYLYVAIYIPSPETNIYFEQAIMNDFQISYDEFVIARKLLGNELETEVDIGIKSNSNAPKYLIFTHQNIDRAHIANKSQNISIFYNRNLLSTYVDIDRKRYPNKFTDIDFATDNYRNYYLTLLELYRNYVGEPLFNPYITFEEFKELYPINIHDLRFQDDYFSPNTIKLVNKYRDDPEISRMFYILIRQRTLTMWTNEGRIIDVV